MEGDRRWPTWLLVVGVLATPVFLFFLLVLAGSECAGPCSYPVWTRPLMAGLFLLGPVALVVGAVGFVATRRSRAGEGDRGGGRNG